MHVRRTFVKTFGLLIVAALLLAVMPVGKVMAQAMTLDEQLDAGDAGVELRRHNLAGRGYTPAQAAARMDAQALDDDRLSGADAVITNTGDPVQLVDDVDAVWRTVILPAARRLRLDRDDGSRAGG